MRCFDRSVFAYLSRRIKQDARKVMDIRRFLHAFLEITIINRFILSDVNSTYFQFHSVRRHKHACNVRWSVPHGSLSLLLFFVSFKWFYSNFTQKGWKDHALVREIPTDPWRHGDWFHNILVTASNTRVIVIYQPRLQLCFVSSGVNVKPRARELQNNCIRWYYHGIWKYTVVCITHAHLCHACSMCFQVNL